MFAAPALYLYGLHLASLRQAPAGLENCLRAQFSYELPASMRTSQSKFHEGLS
ncbi:hypothetical protein D3C72_1282830 [compost metagenome]